MRLGPARCFSLLTTRASSPFAGTPSTGERIDQALAAALTAGMEERIYLAGRLALCRDWHVAERLERELMLLLSAHAAAQKWKPDRPGRLRNLAGLAIIEHCDPSLACISRMVAGEAAEALRDARSELGAAETDAERKAAQAACKAARLVYMEAQERDRESARRMWTGIPRQSWDRTWAPRYQLAWEQLAQWVGVCEAHVKREQREDIAC